MKKLEKLIDFAIGNTSETISHSEIKGCVEATLIAAYSMEIAKTARKAETALEAVYTATHLGDWNKDLDRECCNIRLRYFNALKALDLDSTVHREALDYHEKLRTRYLMQFVKNRCAAVGIELA